MVNIEQIRSDIKKLGYAVIEPFLSSEELQSLQTECEILRELALESGPASQIWGSAARQSCIFETIPGHICKTNPELRTSYSLYKSKRSTWPLQPSVFNLLFSSHITQLISAIVGSSAVLFNEQYIVKPGNGGSAASFAWHRDSDWCRDGVVPQPYISLWVALDDMKDDNGCFVVRPKSHAVSEKFVHLPGLHPESIVQECEEPLPLKMRAGSAVITSDVVLHSSGPNCTAFARRAWMPQFSCKPIVWRDSNEPVSLAIPLNGES